MSCQGASKETRFAERLMKELLQPVSADVKGAASRRSWATCPKRTTARSLERMVNPPERAVSRESRRGLLFQAKRTSMDFEKTSPGAA